MRTILFSIIFSCHWQTTFAQSISKSFYLKGIMNGIPSGKIYVMAESQNGKVLIDSVSFDEGKKFTHLISKFKAPGLIYLNSNTGNLPNSFDVFYVSSLTDTLSFEVTKDGKVIKKDPANVSLTWYTECESRMSAIISGEFHGKNREEVFKNIHKSIELISKKLKKDNATKLLADYFEVNTGFYVSEFSTKVNVNKLKDLMIMVNKNPDLLNTNITDMLFESFIRMTHSDTLSKNKMERMVEDSFVKLYTNLNVSNELKLKFGNKYSSFLSAKNYFTVLGNYILYYANSMSSPANIATFPRLDPGEKVGNIYGQKLSGDTVDLNIFKTTYKLIIIWGPDCSHCIRAIPDMNEMYRIYQAKNISFVSFAMWKPDSSIVNPFEWKDSYFILKGWRNEFIMKYGISYTPILLLLNKNNEVVELQTEPSEMKQTLWNLFK